MKLTIEIDDELMAKVKNGLPAATEQEAIELSLVRMSTFARLKEHYRKCKPHISYAALREGFDPDYDPRAPLSDYGNPYDD